jgi:glycosyltransferase involved in cell wall biosynthesis
VRDSAFSTSVLIDAQSLQGGSFSRGIGRYSRVLIEHLVTGNPNVGFTLLFNNSSPTENIDFVVSELSRNRLNISSIICKLPIENGRVSEKDAITSISTLVRDLNPDIVLFLSIFEHPFDVIPIELDLSCKTSGIFYDLVPLHFPELFLTIPEARYVFNQNLHRLKSLDTLLSISESSKEYLLKNVGYAGRIDTINGGSFFQSTPNTGMEISKRRGILCVGSDSPHKNIKTLIISYALLPLEIRKIHSLYIVGISESPFPVEIKKIINSLQNHIFFLKHLSDDELQDKYRSVRLTVAPSLMEGLGMPILEAWNEGCVAIGSQKTSLSDIIGSENFSFDPNSTSDLFALMEKILVNDSIWLEEHERLLNQRTKYQWTEVARKASTILGLK